MLIMICLVFDKATMNYTLCTVIRRLWTIHYTLMLALTNIFVGAVFVEHNYPCGRNTEIIKYQGWLYLITVIKRLWTIHYVLWCLHLQTVLIYAPILIKHFSYIIFQTQSLLDVYIVTCRWISLMDFTYIQLWQWTHVSFSDEIIFIIFSSFISNILTQLCMTSSLIIIVLYVLPS